VLSRANLAALALALLASGGVALATRCLSASQAQCSLAALTGRAPALDVPYAGTRAPVVRAMLDLAEVRAGEHVVDLGTGDGRIAIAAGRRGASALGIDIDPVLIRSAQAAAQEAELDNRVRFRTENLFRTPLGQAQVLTLFLLPEINARLRPRILSTMAPGARVVSHAFDMGDWRPDAVQRIGGDRIYLWRVPAQVAGSWRLGRADGRGGALTLHQRYQALGGSLAGAAIMEGKLTGSRIAFVAGGERYEGMVKGRTMTGTLPTRWQATR
jgi:hypothetical protein